MPSGSNIPPAGYPPSGYNKNVNILFSVHDAFLKKKSYLRAIKPKDPNLDSQTRSMLPMWKDNGP